jgi:TRAP-type C4-dicarboxylate transport system permease small subunit
MTTHSPEGPPPPEAAPTPEGGLRRLDRLLAATETVLGGVLVGGITVIVLWQIAMRYVFDRPLAWTEELSRYLFIWLSLIGAALAFQRGSHFLFDQLVGGLSGRIRTVVTTVAQGIVTVILLGGLFFGVRLAYLVRVERSAALDLPMVWVYAALPVSVAFMLIHMVARISGNVGGEKTGWR